VTIVIAGGRRFISTEGTFEQNMPIVIVGDKIVALDKDLSIETRRTFEAVGKTVVASLMNPHGHFAWDVFFDLDRQTCFDIPLGYIKYARGFRAAVEAGVTTFRDLSCVRDTDSFARQAARDGFLPGPTVYACGRAVCRTGGHIWWGNREADDPDEICRAVREQARGGAD